MNISVDLILNLFMKIYIKKVEFIEKYSFYRYSIKFIGLNNINIPYRQNEIH